METTSTNTPVIALVFIGDHKEKLKKWPFAFMVSYEAPHNLTVCLVKTGILNNSARRKTYREVEKALKKLGLQPEVIFYFQHGATVNSVWDMLNLKN